VATSEENAEGEETLKGSIQPGQLADIIVLSRDTFQIDPAEIENARVDLTLLGEQSFTIELRRTSRKPAAIYW
jgi:predicted amidohydrolase YtcJ